MTSFTMIDKDQRGLKLRFCESPEESTAAGVVEWQSDRGACAALELCVCLGSPFLFLVLSLSLSTPSLPTSTSFPPTHPPFHELYLSFLPHPFLEWPSISSTHLSLLSALQNSHRKCVTNIPALTTGFKLQNMTHIHGLTWVGVGAGQSSIWIGLGPPSLRQYLI